MMSLLLLPALFVGFVLVVLQPDETSAQGAQNYDVCTTGKTLMGEASPNSRIVACSKIIGDMSIPTDLRKEAYLSGDKFIGFAKTGPATKTMQTEFRISPRPLKLTRTIAMRTWRAPTHIRCAAC